MSEQSDPYVLKWSEQYDVWKKEVEKLDKEREEEMKLKNIISEETKMKAQLLRENLRKKYDEERFVKSSEEYRKRREKDPNYTSSYERLLDSRMTVDDFIVKKKLGEGGFASVYLVEYKKTGEILALKMVSKSNILKKKSALRVRLERDAMIEVRSPWVVDLKYTFQDDDFLYFAMEFCQGGDFRGILVERAVRDKFFKEKEIAFYFAELILCLETVHKHDLCHRDLKPDNILVDLDGHLKITDFGLCRPFDGNSIFPSLFDEKPEVYEVKKDFEKRVVDVKERRDLFKKKIQMPHMMKTLAGSPHYIPPEMFKKKGYRQECDFWSLGVIVFELFFLYQPFDGSTRREIMQEIVNFNQTLYFPPADELQLYGFNPDIKDLLKMLLCSARYRVGRTDGLHSIEDLKNHDFFKRNGIDWDNIRSMESPIQRKVRNKFDTKYFDKFSKKENTLIRTGQTVRMLAKKKFNTEDAVFQDFTFRKEDD